MMLFRSTVTFSKYEWKSSKNSVGERVKVKPSSLSLIFNMMQNKGRCFFWMCVIEYFIYSRVRLSAGAEST